MFPGAFRTSVPDRAAVVMAATGSTITYAELDDEANRLAHLFRANGLRPGDHVAFSLENHARLLAIAWGAHYAGLYYTAMGPRLTPPEFAYILGNCGARAFITSRGASADTARLAADMPEVEVRLMLDGPIDGYEPYEAAVAAYSSEPSEPRVDGRDMLYSSGTTGQPKGVKAPLPNTPLGTEDAATRLARTLFGVSEETIYLSPAPLYHAAPLRFCMAVHRLGGTVVVMERFEPALALELIERHRVTHSQWVPTMLIRLLKLDPAIRNRVDLSSLRCAIHAAAPCPEAVKEAMIDWWGPILHEYYAGTEGNGFVHCDSAEWLSHRGTVGRALVGSLHILDDDGQELPPGETGTVYFAGGATFEYHNDPHKTAAAADAQGRGWTTLGDVGHLDADGYLYLTDRKAHMIISGGVNVYPQEAENLLALHPAVADVAVIGVPNDDLGEEVKAIIVPVDPGAAQPALAQELMAFCRERLSSIKCPRSVDFRAELPREPTGKLYKRLLRQEYWEGHQSQIL